MALIPIAAVGAMALSAYGVWRHSQVLATEAPAALAADQELAGREAVFKAFGNTPAAIPLLGADALKALKAMHWDTLGTSTDTTDTVPYAGQGDITLAALSAKTYLDVMKDVNANASASGAEPVFDLNKPLPPPVDPAKE